MSVITKIIIVALLIGCTLSSANAGALWGFTDTPVSLQGWFLGGFDVATGWKLHHKRRRIRP